MDLFQTQSYAAPMAERVRPNQLEQVLGQKHLLAEGTPFMHFIKSKRIPSMIFWGPPGVGKTTLAQIISQEVDRPF